MFCFILENIQKLEVLKWKSKTEMPAELRQSFHELWPRARLYLQDLDRNMETKMDLDLLNSPQLYSLRFAASRTQLYSELPVLSKIIQKSKNLRILHLTSKKEELPEEVASEFMTEYYRHLKTDGMGLDNLQLKTGASFPPLEELKIYEDDDEGYAFPHLDLDSCKIWRSSMDWSALRCLEIVGVCPETFFKEMTGAVPNLKVLKFTFELCESVVQNWSPDFQCKDWHVLHDFIHSIVALEELCINLKTIKPFPLWEDIRKLASSLILLDVHMEHKSGRLSDPLLFLMREDLQARTQGNLLAFTQGKLWERLGVKSPHGNQLVDGIIYIEPTKFTKLHTLIVDLTSEGRISVRRMGKHLRIDWPYQDLNTLARHFTHCYIIKCNIFSPPININRVGCFPKCLAQPDKRLTEDVIETAEEVFKNAHTVPGCNLRQLEVNTTQLYYQDTDILSRQEVVTYRCFITRDERFNARTVADGGYLIETNYYCTHDYEE